MDALFQQFTELYGQYRRQLEESESDKEEDSNRTVLISVSEDEAEPEHECEAEPENAPEPQPEPEHEHEHEVAREASPMPVADEFVPSVAMDPVPEEAVTGEPHDEQAAELVDDVIEASREELENDAVEVEAEDDREIEEAAEESAEIPAPQTEDEEDNEVTTLDELQAQSDELISLDDLSVIDAGTPSADEAIRVDEMLSRRSMRDLRKAFTLNDKYRFRRELFGNSDAAMNDTLDVVAAMHSADEAEDYLYNDLGWDASQDDVKDFMAVVKSHFDSK